MGKRAASAPAEGAPAKQSSKCKLPRQWLGTLNNYTPEEVEDFRKWCEARTTYSNAGYEVGSECGTPHLQSFHQNSSLSFDAFKKRFPRMSVTPVGIDRGCVAYVEKDGNLAFECGTYEDKSPGKRTDLHGIAAKVITGVPLIDVARENPGTFAQYASGLGRLSALFEKPRDRNIPKNVIVYHGPTGTGKTLRAFAECTVGEPYVWEPSMNQWFDGYSGQKYVILDEFRGQLPLGMILRLLDRYPMRVQYKGGSVQFVADTVVITSPSAPKFWYSDSPTDRIAQLLRRITRVEHIEVLDEKLLLCAEP